MNDTMSLKKSYYTFMMTKEDGSLLIYNSFTGVIISAYEKKEIEKIKIVS